MTSRSKEPRSAEGQRSLNVSHGLTLTALIFSAIEVIAAHCDSCAASCSTTIRTARDRTSGENLVGLGMAPSSQGLEPPGNLRHGVGDVQRSLAFRRARFLTSRSH